MRYGAIEITPIYGTVSITKKQRQIVRHYIDTDRSDGINLGRMATEITCQVLATTDNERIGLESMFHSDVEQSLYFRDFYYKRVKVSADYSQEPRSYEAGRRWVFDVKFIALDPVPYDTTTEEALY
jgi:hypothetical protein